MISSGRGRCSTARGVRVRCDDARWQLILYCDGDLEAESARALEQHLETCESCRAELERLQATERAVGEALGDVEDDGDEVVGRIRTGVARERRLREGTRPATRIRSTVLVAAFTALIALTALTVPTLVAPLSASPREVEVEWPGAAADGATVAVRVWCRDAVSREPLSGERVALAVHDSADYRRGPVSSALGVTDSEGLYHGRIRVPASSRPADVRLNVEAGTGLTSTEMDHTLRVVPRRRAFVWLDRGPARAGSKLAVAGLLLRAADGTAAGGEAVRLSVISPEGTLYMTRDDRTDASGFVRASTSFPPRRPPAPTERYSSTTA
ncbi:MAG: hypothetical protein GF320_11845 [Armatimonadia bacterium]|nr:hypothetical protein [Armatimonadia bacterium]